MSEWFDERLAAKWFRAYCGPDVTLLGIAVSRPETREVTARYRIGGERKDRWASIGCGGGAEQLRSRAEALGQVARRRSQGKWAVA